MTRDVGHSPISSMRLRGLARCDNWIPLRQGNKLSYLDAGFYLRHLYLHIEDVGLINEIARTYPELRLDLALLESNT